MIRPFDNNKIIKKTNCPAFPCREVCSISGGQIWWSVDIYEWRDWCQL